MVVSDWIESAFSWLGGVFDLSPGPHSWEERPIQAAWKDAVSMLWRTLMSDLVHSPPDFGSYLTAHADFEKADKYSPARPSAVFFEYFKAWVKQFRLIQENHRNSRPVDTSTRGYQEIEALSHQWLPQMERTTGRRLGALHCSRIALLPGNTRVGDRGVHSFRRQSPICRQKKRRALSARRIVLFAWHDGWTSCGEGRLASADDPVSIMMASHIGLQPAPCSLVPWHVWTETCFHR